MPDEHAKVIKKKKKKGEEKGTKCSAACSALILQLRPEVDTLECTVTESNVIAGKPQE